MIPREGNKKGLHSNSGGGRSLLNRRETGIAIAALVMFIALSLLSPNFRSEDNLLNVVRQISLMCIVATGMTMLFVVGELDLSVGAMYVLLTVIEAHLLLEAGWPLPLGIASALLLGTLCGLINGLVTTRLRIPAFVTTLGSMSVFSGLSLVISGGIPITGLEAPGYKALVSGYVFGVVPAQVFWMAGVMLIGGIFLARTRFGYQVYATGGNRQAAESTGIPVNAIKVACFAITGFLVGLAAVISVGWLRGGSPSQNTGFELDVIAAVIIGGTNLFGGSGTVFGTFLGAAIMGMIANGLVLLGLSAYWQPVAKGLIVIGAVALDLWVRARQAQLAKRRVLAEMQQPKS